MHEGNFTEQIVEAIVAELKNHPGLKPKRVKVKVGEMLHLESESVKMHFASLTRGTALEHAALDLEEVPVLVRCGDCQEEGPVADHHLLMCENCDSKKVEMIQGNDIVIEGIELDTGEAR